ncbi:glycoside hydrolase family 13 protein [Paenibacillus silvae]|uniref:glycoside hydrolase family 13 protein n=1 Tax=Paenibacillus silvae TaxID=1325358 RepID=UPI0025A0E932|nr:alpha-glucosidase [Paenibacillus silvae]MDM5277630.1 alpha-glucosidase [Paenibacillus silvae]
MKRLWWKEATAYQIYPRSFMDSNGDGIGDIQGILSKLDYIQELGIDLIWICPMYKSPNDDNGYDISDYCSIMDEFGTMDDFDQLLQEVHRRGMKLIMDLVINHTSDEHPWFIESRSSVDNPKRDWYIWRDGRNEEEPNNWESIFGGSAWQYDETTGQYYLHLFSKKQPDLNWANAEVRKSIYQMMNWWMDKGIDGFRVDAISHIHKEEGLLDMPAKEGVRYISSFEKHMNVKGIQRYLQEMKEETLSKYNVVTVGEANGVKVEDSEDLLDWICEVRGKFNMVFQFEHLDLWNNSTDRQLDVSKLKNVMTKWQKALEGIGWNALFIENHDQPRKVSSWGNDTQYWYESATALGAMYFFMQGTPFIYQGQEIGMTNVSYPSIEDYNDIADQNLYRIKREEGMSHEQIMNIIWASSRDNSRTPMQWSAGNQGGFTTGIPWLRVNDNYFDINVEKQMKEPHSVLQFYKQMIRLRKQHDTLIYGTYELLLPEHPEVFAYTRTLESKQVLVLINLSGHTVEIDEDALGVRLSEMWLNNYEKPVSGRLQPYEARIGLCDE